MNNHDISWLSLGLGSLLLLIPLFIFIYYKTKLVKPFIIAFARMFVQLLLVGVYLKVIFELDSVWLNLLWVLLMMVAATATILKRTEMKTKYFISSVSIGVFAGIALNTLIFAFVIIGFDVFFSARYIIPITGMIIGNCLSNAIIGIRAFYQGILNEEDYYRYNLVLSGSRKSALFLYISTALSEAFNPSIASLATMGLIWLPGMMTGQILGGTNPFIAIKYQMIVMVAIFASGVITTVVSILISQKSAFNDFDMLKKEIVVRTKKKV